MMVPLSPNHVASVTESSAAAQTVNATVPTTAATSSKSGEMRCKFRVLSVRCHRLRRARCPWRQPLQCIISVHSLGRHETKPPASPRCDCAATTCCSSGMAYGDDQGDLNTCASTPCDHLPAPPKNQESTTPASTLPGSRTPL